ncbi:glycosyltransferase family 2 protein [Jannaschia sp. Os4]|uniref:glycosyltransferase n=1 Tax=Jannaschia sp. Os4 TaxID=2807617 RepID=UPI001939EF48|nr:glycosyltransferase family 2 protein [Jannaschia sp. Os4]
MTAPRLGVVVVTHRSADVIGPCLASLMASEGTALRVVVVDNASPDDTLAVARGVHVAAPHSVEIDAAPVNAGFAGGVNRGLARLFADDGLDRVWLLNPDCTARPDTAAVLAACGGDAPWGMIGGRVLYDDPPGVVQSDGGRLDRRTGRTDGINRGRPAAEAAMPARMDFVSGAHLVASRALYERAGPMPDETFLYYEEVAWARRLGDLPILPCPGAVVHHRAGTSIGSGRPGRRASPMSTYFLHRARHRFVRAHLPQARLGAMAFSWAKAAQMAAKGDLAGADALLRGALDRPPPAAVRDRLDPAARTIAFR